MFKGWLTAAGATVTGDGIAFISATVSYGGEGLDAVSGATIATPCVIRRRDDGGSGLLSLSPLADGTHVYAL